jgi:hypothetical protein
MRHLSLSHRRCNLWRSLDHRQPAANPGRYVAAHDLVIALADAIVLERPVHLPRRRQQVLLLARGRRQLYLPRRRERALVLARVRRHTYLPRRQEQVLLIVQGRCRLYLRRQHPLLPPPTLLREMPTNSVMVTHHSHHGSAHDESTVLVVFAGLMAPRLPIHRSTFSAGGDIGPTLPANLLVMAGIRPGRGILLLLVLLEALFWTQFSWLKTSLLFVFLSFGSFG